MLLPGKSQQKKDLGAEKWFAQNHSQISLEFGNWTSQETLVPATGWKHVSDASQSRVQ